MTDNLILQEFQALCNLSQLELRAEFQGTSHLGPPPNDVPPKHYRMMIELSKLRRKSWKCSTIDCNFINLDPCRIFRTQKNHLPPPKNHHYAVPLKKTLLRLKDQLERLNHSLESEQSLCNLFEIDICLDELRPFTNAIRLCKKSETCSDNPQAFTLYRSHFVLRGYAWFLNDLSRLFTSFRSLYRSEKIEQSDRWWVQSIFNQIDGRIEDFDRKNIDMVRHEWAVMIRQFDGMRHQTMVRLKSLEIRYDPTQENLAKACRGFILLTKLTRLLMNKISRLTNKEYLLRLKTDQVEKLNARFETIRNSFYRLLTSVDQNNEPPVANFRPLDKVARCLADTCHELSLHFESLDPNSNQDFILEMLEWCERFRQSFQIAVKTFIPENF